MYHVLTSESRTPKTEMSAHQLRKGGLIPCVLFGKDFEPVSLQISHADFKRMHAKHVQVLKLQISGDKEHLVNVESIQRDPVTNQVMHVAFHRIKKGQKTKVHIPIVITGQDKRLGDGGIINHIVSEIEAYCPPASVPESIEVDVSAMKVGELFHLRDIKIPVGVEISDADMELTVVNCAYPKVQEEAPAEAEETVAEAAPVEEAAPEVEEKKAA